jgi:hypothetical protein
MEEYPDYQLPLNNWGWQFKSQAEFCREIGFMRAKRKKSKSKTAHFPLNILST